MPRFLRSASLPLVAALLLAALFASDCPALCLSCWKLKGVLVHLKNGTTIEGYAAWNDVWAQLGYEASGEQSKAPPEQELAAKKEFPEVIFDARARIEGISVYTHLRSIKYPVKDALVATRKPVRV